MNERDFQAWLIKELKQRFPNCIVMKTDPTYIQGLPDLLILHNDKWAALEVKKSLHAHHQPNQDFYISKMHEMSYATFICPENADVVLDELEEYFNDI